MVVAFAIFLLAPASPRQLLQRLRKSVVVAADQQGMQCKTRQAKIQLYPSPSKRTLEDHHRLCQLMRTARGSKPRSELEAQLEGFCKNVRSKLSRLAVKHIDLELPSVPGLRKSKQKKSTSRKPKCKRQLLPETHLKFAFYDRGCLAAQHYLV